MTQGFGQQVLNPKQPREAKSFKQSVLQHFQTLPGPCLDQTGHRLTIIVAITILAVLGGADGFVAIETYGKAKQAWMVSRNQRYVSIVHRLKSMPS